MITTAAIALAARIGTDTNPHTGQTLCRRLQERNMNATTSEGHAPNASNNKRGARDGKQHRSLVVPVGRRYVTEIADVEHEVCANGAKNREEGKC